MTGPGQNLSDYDKPVGMVCKGHSLELTFMLHKKLATMVGIDMTMVTLPGNFDNVQVIDITDANASMVPPL